MMKKFKDLFQSCAFNQPIAFPSVEVTLNQNTLQIKFDSRDVVVNAGYSGSVNPWLSALCHLIVGKKIDVISLFNWRHWVEEFNDDQTFWDLKQEQEDLFFNKSFELLKAALDIYSGREYLYQETGPLICRCFGVREGDVIEYLKKNDTVTLDGLCGETDAGMGCRACVPQLKRWVLLHGKEENNHFYKERAVVDWLLDVDFSLSQFPNSLDWKMEVQRMKGTQVTISFDKVVSQQEEEAVAKELQGFLTASVDPGLSFFLRRVRHFSKAKG